MASISLMYLVIWQKIRGISKTELILSDKSRA
jgi:hypothetical protein